MNPLKKFIRGEETLGFAFFVYGIVGYFVFRFLMAAPALVLVKMRTRLFDYYLVFIRFVYIAVLVFILVGIWNCSKKTDMLPRMLVLFVLSAIAFVYLFSDCFAIYDMLLKPLFLRW